jgi:hypothetical protein
MASKCTKEAENFSRDSVRLKWKRNLADQTVFPDGLIDTNFDLP